MLYSILSCTPRHNTAFTPRQRHAARFITSQDDATVTTHHAANGYTGGFMMPHADSCRQSELDYLLWKEESHISIY